MFGPSLLLPLFIFVLCTFPFVQLKPEPYPDQLGSYYDNVPNDEASDEADEYDGDYDGSEGGISPSEDENAKIISVPKRIAALEGDNVEFECQTDKIGLFVVQWFKGKQLIFQDDLFALSRDLKSHYSKSVNNTLTILNVTADDKGEYICQVKAAKDLTIKHHLSVKIPPKIVRILPNDNYQAELNERLTMVCEATGSPPPKVNWAKQGERLPQQNKRNSSTITFDNIKLHDAGTYQCMADNQVGDPAISQITIRVAHKPQIEIEKSTISSEKDYTSVLTCIARATPPAITEWFKDGKRIETNEKYNVSNQGHYHILQIKKTSQSDFGKYTCESKNGLGTTKKVIELTASPVPVSFEVVPVEGHKAIFKWSFQSLAPILMYDLQLKYPNSHYIGIFNDDCNPGKEPVGNIYSVQCEMKDLGEGEYQAKVNAKNTYGESHYKEIKFKIEPVPANISDSNSGNHLQTTFVLYLLAAVIVNFYS